MKGRAMRLLRNVVLLICLLGLAMLLRTFCTRTGKQQRQIRTEIVRDTIVIRDTIRITAPQIVEREKTVKQIVTVVKTVPQPPEDSLPRAPDSVMAQIPITRKHYAGMHYDAWVSGFNAQLDSINIYPQTRIVTESITRHTPQKRWHLGISAGGAVTPKGIQPYVGIGITYSFLSW